MWYVFRKGCLYSGMWLDLNALNEKPTGGEQFQYDGKGQLWGITLSLSKVLINDITILDLIFGQD